MQHSKVKMHYSHANAGAFRSSSNAHKQIFNQKTKTADPWLLETFPQSVLRFNVKRE